MSNLSRKKKELNFMMKKNYSDMNGNITQKIISKKIGLNMLGKILKTGKVHLIMNLLDLITNKPGIF